MFTAVCSALSGICEGCRFVSLFKHLCPAFEAFYTFRSKLFQTADCLFDGLFFVKSCLGIEFIGIADYLFFERFRTEIDVG